jgi:hypothetical protein
MTAVEGKYLSELFGCVEIHVEFKSSLAKSFNYIPHRQLRP